MSKQSLYTQAKKARHIKTNRESPVMAIQGHISVEVTRYVSQLIRRARHSGHRHGDAAHNS